MDVLKRFVRGFCSQLFKLSIYLAAVSAAVITVFGTPTNIKDTLKSSGVYTKAVDSVIEEAKKDQGDETDSTGVNNVPVDDPAVQAAIKNALPPEFVEQTGNNAIDGIFNWLQGKTKTPQFSIDLQDAKQKLANGVADAAYQRASSLPVCTPAQLRALNPNEIDIFSLPCVPPGVKLQTERDKVAQNIMRSDEVLKDPTITSEDLPKQNGQTVFDKADVVPTVYQWFVRSPWILTGVAILTAAGVILLHNEKRRGIWTIGRALLISGILLVLSGLIANYVVGKAPLTGEGSLQLAFADLLRNVVHQFDTVLIKFGVVYTVLGAGTMLAIHLTKPQELEQKPVAETTVQDTAQPAETTQEPVKTKNKPQE